MTGQYEEGRKHESHANERSVFFGGSFMELFQDGHHLNFSESRVFVFIFGLQVVWLKMIAQTGLGGYNKIKYLI